MSAATYDQAQERAAAHTVAVLTRQRRRQQARRTSLSMGSAARSPKVAPADGAAIDPAATEQKSSSSLQSQFESYQFLGEDSRLHLELRTNAGPMHHRILDAVTVLMIIMIAVALACLAVTMVVMVTLLHTLRLHAVESVLWSCERAAPSNSSAASSTSAACTSLPARADVLAAGGVFIALGTIFALLAASLVFWEPSIFGSGLPRLKAFLNGCHVDILSPRALVAKVSRRPRYVVSGRLLPLTLIPAPVPPFSPTPLPFAAAASATLAAAARPGDRHHARGGIGPAPRA